MLITTLAAAKKLNLDTRSLTNRARVRGVLIDVDGQRYVDDTTLDALERRVWDGALEENYLDYRESVEANERRWRALLPHVHEVTERIMGISAHDLATKRRAVHVYGAQLALILLLHMHDVPPIAIGRLLDRDHSSVLYAQARMGIGAHRRVDAAQIRETYHTARAAARMIEATLVDEGVIAPTEHSDVTLDMLDRALADAPPHIAFYINWALLDRPVYRYEHAEPVLGPRSTLVNVASHAIRGVYALASCPRERARIEGALVVAGLDVHRTRIRQHADTLGYRWVS